MYRAWLLLFPVTFGVIALKTGATVAKLGVPLSCALIVLGTLAGSLGNRRDVFAVVVAFGFSAGGDWFLSHRGGRESYFLAGIALFFIAHLGYLTFAWLQGRCDKRVLGILLLIYLPYYLFLLRPAIKSPVLSLFVVFYLLISCLVFSVAWGIHGPPATRWAYVAGIALIIFSDTIISFREFLGYSGMDRLILPTYYLAQVCVTWAILAREFLGKSPLSAGPTAGP